MNENLDRACDSGVHGYFSSARPDGAQAYQVRFMNGHVERISEREMALMEAAYKQGRTHAADAAMHAAVAP